MPTPFLLKDIVMSDINSFKEKLENEYSFPTLYIFKFIVPKTQVGELSALFEKHDYKTRPSKKGSYISITAQMMVESSDKIIEIYKKASTIKGIISL
ncbi:MAG: putative lipoic acid-binding regulatory protein [Cyclobacteriaceae bacterium]|jgi:putative lipoic acid-binding regulatory protein